MTNIIKSLTGYSCPNCGAICSEETLQSMTKPKFRIEPDSHYEWIEIHKCQKCETIYQLNNGT